jgi:hypothetical protein
MNPLLAFVIAEIVKNAPALAIELVQVLSKPDPTEEDWDTLKAKYRGRTYDQYIKEAAERNPCNPPTA